MSYCPVSEAELITFLLYIRLGLNLFLGLSECCREEQRGNSYEIWPGAWGWSLPFHGMMTNCIICVHECRSKLIKANRQVFSATPLTYRIKKSNQLGKHFAALFQLLAPKILTDLPYRDKWKKKVRNSYNIWTEYVVIGSFWFCVSPWALTGRRQQIHELFPKNLREKGVYLTELYLWRGTALIITFTGDAVKWLIIHSFCTINAGQLNPALFDTMHRAPGQSIIACLCTTVQN